MYIKCKTRRPTQYQLYIYNIYIMCIYTVYVYVYIYRPCAQLNARPTDCPTVPARPTARLARPTNQPNKTKPTMCNVRSIKPLYLWTIPKAPNGKPQQNLYHFFLV